MKSVVKRIIPRCFSTETAFRSEFCRKNSKDLMKSVVNQKIAKDFSTRNCERNILAMSGKTWSMSGKTWSDAAHKDLAAVGFGG
ncbi:MAG: hypothetical protein IKF07_02815 [Eubacterium sp.]|nr:hypothetical protein [Eubacterium sp.]